jgi:hypothetical protein
MRPPSTSAPANVLCPQVTDRWRCVPHRRSKADPSMGPRLVVMIGVGPKGTLKVSLAEHEGPVQALSPNGSPLSFAERLGVRSSDRGNDSHAIRAEHLVRM